MNFTDTYFADFETSVYEGQTYTEVWSAAMVPASAPDEESSVITFTSLDSFMSYVLAMPGTFRIFFHNLKFDGSFILDYLINSPLYEEDTVTSGEDVFLNREFSEKRQKMNSYNYTISKLGQWYNIKVKTETGFYVFQDSLKLLPFPLKKIGKDFQTKHQKLEMEYTGERHAGYQPTEEELHYIKNDVLVLKEGMKHLSDLGIDDVTIGSACLKEFKSTCLLFPSDYRAMFPDLHLMYFDGTGEGESVDDFVRSAYHGGWCYCPEENRHVTEHGCTFDVNSLYPSMMHSMSGNYYPVGLPRPFTGEPDEKVKSLFYVVRFSCSFRLKDGMLPCVQIKDSFLFSPKEWLKSSWTVDRYKEVILTMTKPEAELFFEMYDVDDLVWLGGLYFNQQKGLFDAYIDKWAKIKQTSKGAMRQIAKLMLNNLYGKFAANDDSSYKMAWLNEDGAMRFSDVHEWDKTVGYIPIGAAITAYARCFTIRAALANKDRFCYADTDSIHCIGNPDEIVGVPEHPSAFCHWKCESEWDEGMFTRQKTYIEHVVAEDHEPVEAYYNIKCAGMGKFPKDLLAHWLAEGKMEMTEFKRGLVLPGNLKAHRIRGGVLLEPNDYVMR